jgi:ketosteroid isomerase-like protein
MWQEFSAGNQQGFLSVMADDIRFTVMGTTALSLTTRGKQAMAEKILAPLSAALAGKMQVNVEHLIGEGEWVVMRSTGSAVARNGHPYNNHYAQFFRLQDGMVVEWIEYLDTALLGRILSLDPEVTQVRTLGSDDAGNEKNGSGEAREFR